MKRFPPAVTALAMIFTMLFTILFPSSCSVRKTAHPPRDPRIKVESSRIATGGEFVEIRFRLTAGGKYDPDTIDAFLIDESTGDRFFLMRLQRIGVVEEDRNARGEAIHTVLFKNLDGKLKAGARVTLQVGSITLEHVLLEK